MLCENRIAQELQKYGITILSGQQGCGKTLSAFLYKVQKPTL